MRSNANDWLREGANATSRLGFEKVNAVGEAEFGSRCAGPW